MQPAFWEKLTTPTVKGVDQFYQNSNFMFIKKTAQMHLIFFKWYNMINF